MQSEALHFVVFLFEGGKLSTVKCLGIEFSRYSPEIKGEFSNITRLCLLTYHRQVAFDEHCLDISTVGRIKACMVITYPTYHEL